MRTFFLQLGSTILALAGTWFLAFALRIRQGISEELEKELQLEERGLITPSSVRQNTLLFWTGLAMISLAALLQLTAILWPNGY